MNEQEVQIIEKNGEPEYAVVPIEEYRRMVAALEERGRFCGYRASMGRGRGRRDDTGRSRKGHSRWRVASARVAEAP